MTLPIRVGWETYQRSVIIVKRIEKRMLHMKYKLMVSEDRSRERKSLQIIKNNLTRRKDPEFKAGFNEN